MPWKTVNLMENRTEFARRAQQKCNFRELCREFGISTRVGYKWKKRFLEKGLGGLREESRKPHTSPGGLSEEEVCRIIKFKQRHPHWGPSKLRELYRRQWGKEPSMSSFKRVLEKAGMVQKRRKRSAKAGGRIAEGRRAVAPNEVWTVDFKGWWYDEEGRCEPLTVRDEFSRYVLELRALPNARTETVRECFEKLFAEHGLPQVIRSDNGTPFASVQALLGLSRLSVWWLALGIDLERGRPGCPQDNGAHERFHRDVCAQLERTPYAERQPAFEVWMQEFNELRPHDSLGKRTPAEVYQSSPRRYHGTPDSLEYEGCAVRRVQAGGHISWEAKKIFLTAALGGWDVGLRPGENGLIEVYFARLLLGQIEPSTAAFLPVQPVAPPRPAPLRSSARSATPHEPNPSAALAAERKYPTTQKTTLDTSISTTKPKP